MYTVRIALFGLSRRSPVRDSGAAAERVIAESQRPISRRNELGTVEKGGAVEERPGKIGAVEHRFEEIRTLEMPDPAACYARTHARLR